jgi:hypothetical protein
VLSAYELSVSGDMNRLENSAAVLEAILSGRGLQIGFEDR